jgi:hypothetical protein
MKNWAMQYLWTMNSQWCWKDEQRNQDQRLRAALNGRVSLANNNDENEARDRPLAVVHLHILHEVENGEVGPIAAQRRRL